MIGGVELRIAISGEGARVDTVPMRMLSRLVSAYLSALRAVAAFNEIAMPEPTAAGSGVREGSSVQALMADPIAARAAECLHAAMMAPNTVPELRRALNDLAAAARELREGWVASAGWGTGAYMPIPDKAPPVLSTAEITTRPTRITGHNRERGPADVPVIYATDVLRDINYAVETDERTALDSVAWERPGVQVDLKMRLQYSVDGKLVKAELLKVDAVRGPWSVAETLAWFGEEFGTA